MKIKIYIVTYKNSIDLNNNLKSLFSSNLNGKNLKTLVLLIEKLVVKNFIKCQMKQL